MFTGIVEATGRLRQVTPVDNGVELTIAAPATLCADLRPGASIAVDGVCQTVLQHGEDFFRVAAEAETLRVTTLGARRSGDAVNLERSLPVGGRLDGHVVLGHVDGTANVLEVQQDARSWVLTLELPEPLSPFVVPKGCIAVDGVSLTVGPEVQAGRFRVFLIPYTWEHTTLHDRRAGDSVNVETDILARYLVHLLGPRPATWGSGPLGGGQSGPFGGGQA